MSEKNRDQLRWKLAEQIATSVCDSARQAGYDRAWAAVHMLMHRIQSKSQWFVDHYLTLASSERVAHVRAETQLDILLTHMSRRDELRDNFNVLHGGVSKVPESEGQCDFHDVLQELMTVERDYPVAYKQYGGGDGRIVMRVNTGPITLEGVELNDFDVIIDTDTPRASGRCEANDPIYGDSDHLIPHPHIENGYVCMGDASAASNTAALEGRISDHVDLVMAVVTNYNPSGPFIALENWGDGPCCADCGSSFDVCNCVGCGESFCEAHQFFCEGAGGTYCDQCCTRCSHCDQYEPHDEMLGCKSCHEVSCRYCREEDDRNAGGECVSCSAWVCSNCLEVSEDDEQHRCVSCSNARFNELRTQRLEEQKQEQASAAVNP